MPQVEFLKILANMDCKAIYVSFYIEGYGGHNDPKAFYLHTYL
jgi:hypothetical protein